ncbi:hypothetical protein Pcar_3329 [Syntrophotalea carbinolica DSM 2380]|uniref:Uncharacterized protein n=1 Tax=Syntrophotalea carbinolica (strain DSM 2380 / NBRC 103641 / GraBd1) TaxID=338963 RepID=Q0C6J3_SYNC1|nr:hypothetical protein [Syntrophotalea carbinolica]ABI81945.1 hypothetical protein Pcar_3329 [Syntrophotalea carbinolica DSM 2380]
MHQVSVPANIAPAVKTIVQAVEKFELRPADLSAAMLEYIERTQADRCTCTGDGEFCPVCAAMAELGG